MDITFLKEDQIWGDKALQVIKSYGTKTGMSDLGILLGGAVSKSDNTTSDGQRTGYVLSASSYGDGYVRNVHANGDRDCCNPYQRPVGARPALPSSVASSIRLSEAKPSKKISGVDIVEYGEYPQTIAPETVNRELEQSFSRGQLQTTGKKYTFDSEAVNALDNPFNAKEHAEYQHKGKKYIRVEAKSYGDGYSTLSNGKTPQTGEVYWVQVQPIEWLRDPSGICVARQALFAGVQFDRNQSYDGNFAKTDMKQYLDKFFAKEMQAGRNVAASAAVVGPSTASVTARRDTQRQRALDDPSQGL